MQAYPPTASPSDRRGCWTLNDFCPHCGKGRLCTDGDFIWCERGYECYFVETPKYSTNSNRRRPRDDHRTQ